MLVFVMQQNLSYTNIGTTFVSYKINLMLNFISN